MLDRDLMRKAAEEATKGRWSAIADDERECWRVTDLQPGGSQSHDGDGADEHIADVFDPANALFIALAHPAAVLALLESERRLKEQVAAMQPVYEAVQEIPLGNDGRFWEFVCRSLMETGEEGAAIAESIRGWINKLESACGQALADSEGGAG